MVEQGAIRWFHEINKEDIALVGGKGANLGELTQSGVHVPPGFCVTAEAYTTFISERELDQSILEKMKELDYENNRSAQSSEW